LPLKLALKVGGGGGGATGTVEVPLAPATGRRALLPFRAVLGRAAPSPDGSARLVPGLDESAMMHLHSFYRADDHIHIDDSGIVKINGRSPRVKKNDPRKLTKVHWSLAFPSSFV
jgi:hypothetical protein